MYAETIERNSFLSHSQIANVKLLPTPALFTAPAPLPLLLTVTSCCYTHDIQSTSFWIWFCRCSCDGRKDVQGGHSENRKLSFCQCGWSEENFRLLLAQVYVVAECGTVRWAFRIFSYFFSIYKNVKFIILYIYEICLNLIYIFLFLAFSRCQLLLDRRIRIRRTYVRMTNLTNWKRKMCFRSFPFSFFTFLLFPECPDWLEVITLFQNYTVTCARPLLTSSTDRIVAHVWRSSPPEPHPQPSHHEECSSGAAYQTTLVQRDCEWKDLTADFSMAFSAGNITQPLVLFIELFESFSHIPNHSARRKHIYHSHEWRPTLSHRSSQTLLRR